MIYQGEGDVSAFPVRANLRFNTRDKGKDDVSALSVSENLLACAIAFPRNQNRLDLRASLHLFAI